MKDKMRKKTGLELLIQQHKDKFDTQENLNYYSYKDFLKAKRKYLKYVLEGTFGTSQGQIQ